MKAKLDKLASFRINSERWEKFKEVAETQGKTATDLLNEYIDRVIGVGVGVDTASGLPSDNSPKLSIQDIDKRIDKKISNTLSIQDIDDTVKKLIADSLADGDIGEAIAKCYSNMMGQFNELLNQMEELKAAIPPAVAPCSQSPVTNNQSPVTSPRSTVTNPPSQITEDQKLELIELLGIEGILAGEIYYQELLIEKGIDDRVIASKEKLESLGIKFTGRQNTPTKRINFILRRLGYFVPDSKQKIINGKKGVETYQV